MRKLSKEHLDLIDIDCLKCFQMIKSIQIKQTRDQEKGSSNVQQRNMQAYVNAFAEIYH